MLTIKVHGVDARWDELGRMWRSEFDSVELLLNYTLPMEQLAVYSAPFVEGGLQGMALKAAQALLDVTVVKITPPDVNPIPPEGIVY